MTNFEKIEVKAKLHLEINGEDAPKELYEKIDKAMNEIISEHIISEKKAENETKPEDKHFEELKKIIQEVVPEIDFKLIPEELKKELTEKYKKAVEKFGEEKAKEDLKTVAKMALLLS